MTNARKQLLDDARAAGYTIETDNGGTTTIIKRVGRWRKPVGLIMYPDGGAVRAETALHVQAVVTDFKTMRLILEI